MKACIKCHIEKRLIDFYRESLNKDGRANVCKICRNIKTEEWRIKNREKYNADMRLYYKNNRDAVISSKLKQKYGITLQQKNEMLEKQDHRCWICKKTNQSKKRPFVIDHRHHDLKIRGILCYGCNRALHTLDDQGLLHQALAYLEFFK